MKKKEGFVLRNIAQEAVIVGESLELIDFDCLVALNPTAAYLWQALENQPFDAHTLAALLTARYEVAPQTALTHAQELLNTWLEAGIIEA